MIAELGHFALILAFFLTVALAIFPLLGQKSWRFQVLAPSLAVGQFLFVAIAYAALTYGFIVDDFSILYVASNSNTALPLVYKISAVWGGHEGSLLLWLLMLSGWTLAVALFSNALPLLMRARILAVLGMVAVGLLAFVLLTSNPFLRLFPAPLEGRDLNPLLQDPGLVLHPPLLYMGYVGTSVAFAFAIAALLAGQVDSAWARWSRPWTTAAWAFLTIGIALGSWWAYNELGWGGWWFWDPVENASFIPWLVSTALIHSLAATEKRGTLKSWTLLLAISAFALSLLGTFLVRSGVLVSVHAFANDPERGVFILAFIAVVVGASLALYAWRAPRMTAGGQFAPVSRESFLLANNILMVSAAFTVLLGTLYPLLLDALNAGKISVGPPYFDATFVPLMLPALLLMGLAPLAKWKAENLLALLAKAWPLLAISLLTGVGLLWFYADSPRFWIGLGLVLAFWAIFSALFTLAPYLGKSRQMTIPLHLWGMLIAHVGVGLFAIGVAITSNFSIDRDIRLAPGETQLLGDYQLRLEGISRSPGANYVSNFASVTLLNQKGEVITTLNPEKRIYLAQAMPMTEAAVHIGWTRDIYVALGEPLRDGAWSFHIAYKPMIRLIWLGALLMALGGFIAISDRRYRLQRHVTQASENTQLASAKAG
jgi:cytochrome c-type biogenesis protein CcmF